MAEAIQPGRLTALQLAAACAAGAAAGLLCLLGLLSAAGLLAFLACAVLVTLFKGLYKGVVLAGVVLLACVFIEPSPSDVILAACIPLGLATGAFRPRELGRAAAAAALMLGYFIASLPGVAVSLDVTGAIRYYLITFYLFLLALFVATYATRDNITSLLRAYMLAAFLSLAAGAAGLAGLFPDILMMDPYRVRGLFKDPNVFGPFFVPAVILLMEDMKHRRILKAPRPLHVLGIALLTLGVVVSYSRAAWINMAASALLYPLLNVRAFRLGRLLGALLAGGLALAAGAFLFLNPAFKDTTVVSFIEERAKIQDYDQERFGAQQGGLIMIEQNPLGVGPGQFEGNIAGITGLELSSHSLYVRTAAENGVAGFLLFFASTGCVLFMLWSGRRALRRDEATVGISPAALLAILSGLLVNSAVVDTLHWRHLWFFLGIALYCIRETGKEACAHGRPSA